MKIFIFVLFQFYLINAKAEFEKRESGTFSYASVPSIFTPSINFTVSTFDNWIGLEINKKTEIGSITSSTSGYFEKEGDQFSINFTERSSTPKSCELRSYRMICFYTSQDL